MTLIYAYTREQAIEDGVLIRYEDFARMERIEGVRLEQIPKRLRKLETGEIVVTAAAAAALNGSDVVCRLALHVIGEWGDVCDEDRDANNRALVDGGRVLSVYEAAHKDRKDENIRFYIITEWNREATTVLLPEDY